MAAPEFPVDLVYSWSDGGGEGRGEARAEWLARSADVCMDAATPNRVRDRGELRYSLRSVHAHLPWVGTIHLIVSGGRRPGWIVDHPRVRFVEDTEIFPDPGHLPTFNSQAIECHLERVPGLADHYLYANDDFLFCRPVGWRSYFRPDGAPLVAWWRYGWTARVRGKRFHQGWRGRPDPAESAFQNAWMNVNALIDGEFGERPRYVSRHHASPLRMGMLVEAGRLFPEAMARTSRSRFRSTTDVAPVALAQHVALQQRRAVPSQGGLRELVVLVGDDPRLNARRLRQARLLRPHLLCLNDMTSAEAAPEVDTQVRVFLERLFPEPSPFEAPLTP
ncbi:MAG: stealth conserved region 3 domain-containing protein [Vicinamibacterales bacterium]